MRLRSPIPWYRRSMGAPSQGEELGAHTPGSFSGPSPPHGPDAFGFSGFALPYKNIYAFGKELLSFPGLSLQGAEAGQPGRHGAPEDPQWCSSGPRRRLNRGILSAGWSREWMLFQGVIDPRRKPPNSPPHRDRWKLKDRSVGYALEAPRKVKTATA